MAEPDVTGWMSVVATILGGIVWLLRLEGRVNTHQAMQSRLVEDVQYIRKRIDDVLNERR